MVDFFGYAAMTLVLLAYVPQILKTWQTRKIDDLSLGTALMLEGAAVLWIVYGIMIVSWPVIIVNVGVSISIILIGIIAWIRR